MNSSEGPSTSSTNDSSRRSDECCSSVIGEKIERYLDCISKELETCKNPGVKEEQRKLLELLKSYKKLCLTVAKKSCPLSEKVGSIPEIYQILHPELYRDANEEEKNKLRSRLAKRPAHLKDPKSAVIYKSSSCVIPDKRQREKERFVRLVSTAPSPLLQSSGSHSARRSGSPCVLSSRLIRSPSKDRDTEKERLVNIFSSDVNANPAFRKTLVPPNKRSKKPLAKNEERKPNANPLKPSPQDSSSRRPGPLKATPLKEVGTARHGRSSQGINGLSQKLPLSGDHVDERRKKLLNQKKKEYQEYISHSLSSKMDKATLTREASILGEAYNPSPIVSPRSVASVSTQTEVPDSSLPLIKQSPVIADSQRMAVTNPFIAAEMPNKLFPVYKEPFITSPRAKLIKDLHGVSPCLPGASPLLTIPDEGGLDEKVKQMLYAEALKAQIVEKKRLEEEKRKKEMEEEEMIERKAREQQLRLKMEYEREQSLKNDWLIQRQAQEESLRQRLIEMEKETMESRQRARHVPVSSSDVHLPQQLSPHAVQEQLMIPRAIQDSSSLASTSVPTNSDKFGYTPSTPTSRHLEEGTLRPRPAKLNLALANGHSTFQKHTYDSIESGRAELPKGYYDRPISPVLPALQTDNLMRKSPYVSPRVSYAQDDNETAFKEDKVFTQLGIFRKELELEQERLEKKLQLQQQQQQKQHS